MEKLISEQIVDSILSQDTDAFVGAFNAAIASKVSDALEVKKVEIASNLIAPEMAVEEEVEQIDEGKYEDSRTHWETHVAPLYKKHGLSPKFANAVNAHVKKHGDSQVWNYHGSAGGGDPHWFDSKKGKVKPLRKKSGYEIAESWEISDEEVEQVEEAFRLFHPGKKATIKSIDKHGFTGRDDHPPTDGSLNGHTIRITNYGDATGSHGVTSGYGGPRYQAVRGKVLTGKHKGKEFEFIQHELKHAEDVKEEVEQVEEGAKEWKQAFKKVSSKNLNKDVAAVRSSAYRLDKATKSDDEDDEEVKDKVRKGMSEEAEQIDELKKSTLKSYVKKANREMKKAYDYHQMGQGGRDGTDQNYLKNAYPKALAKYDRRDAGVEKAKQKLAKSDKK